MLTRIIFIVVLPALMACEALKELGNPTGPEEEEIVEEVASAPEEEDPVEAIEEPAPEVAALSSEEALQALEDLGIPYSQRSFIEHAAEGGLEVVRLFVWAGMDVDVQPYASKTVLVSTRERPTALSHLEASWFPQEEDNDTALMKAAGNGHLEVVEFLLESGADLSLKNQQGQSAIMFAAAGGHLEIVKLIVRCECDNRLFVSGPSPLGGYDPLIHGPLTAVNWAAYNGHLDVIEFLFFDDDAFELDNSGWAHWNTQPEWGFYWGIIGGHMDVVEYFMEVMPRRISVSWGLMIASYLGDIEMVDRLLQEENINIHWRTSRWIDINTPEGTLYFEEIGFGPLHAAIQQGHEEVLRKLLMHWMITIGADGADRHGETALMFAARWGRTDIVSMLIAEGANASFVNAYNETALSLAEENGHEDVVALLQ